MSEDVTSSRAKTAGRTTYADSLRRNKEYKGLLGVSTPRDPLKPGLEVGRGRFMTGLAQPSQEGGRPELNRRPPEPQSGALTN